MKTRLKFLDRYLDTLDPQHIHFLQSDLADFEPWRTNLDRMILPERRGTAPDVRPATIIFNRYVERLQQRVDYADEMLKNEKFAFDKDERVTVIRKDGVVLGDVKCELALKLARQTELLVYVQLPNAADVGLLTMTLQSMPGVGAYVYSL